MARLLILSCSQKKRPGPAPLPAIERYDGPAYRVLRKYLRSEPIAPPSTWVLSAKYGLVNADHPMQDYDQRMTEELAKALRPAIQKRLRSLLYSTTPGPGELFLYASGSYLSTLGFDQESGLVGYDVRNEVSGGNNNRERPIKAKLASGRIGGRVAELRDWLYGSPPSPPDVMPHKGAELVVFRGVELRLTVQDVLLRAAAEAVQDPVGAARFEAWYVQVGERRVAPKWLVSMLSGVPVSNFRTSDARHLLAQLGIEVCRT